MAERPAVNSTSRKSDSSDSALDVVVLADTSLKLINTIKDHLDGLTRFSRNRVTVLDYRIFNRPNRSLAYSLDRFDVVVLHYSVVVAEGRLSQFFRDRMKAYRGLKIIFLQDEYRSVDSTAKAISDCGFHVLFSVVNKEIVDKVYRHAELKAVRKEVTLTGFVPVHLLSRQTPRYEARSIDVGYRARKLPAWLGNFAQEKWQIGESFLSVAGRFGLTCDIASDEHKRLYGESWIEFVSSCKAVLGTESGASICDFDGSIKKRVDAYETQFPNASFEDIRSKIFADADGALTIHVISPRCFEAAALRTLMIMYPGTYSGLLEPWRHYVPLERDFSNIGDVVAVLRDPVRAGAIIDCAYNEVACDKRNTFEAMVSQFDTVIGEEFPKRGYSPASRSPSLAAIQRHGRRTEVLMQWRQTAITRGTRTAAFLIETLVPERAKGAVMRFARAKWRALIGGSGDKSIA
ncbi:MAG: hypothetical protein HY242_05600 [Afipia sp.]|nr:hypothetical protein [Afipia sp.]